MTRSRRRAHSGHQRFTQLHEHFLDDPAWKSLSASARLIYIAIKRYYNGNNNGSIHLSVRRAAADTGLSPSTAQRAFRELTARGFIKMAARGFLGIEGRGIANKWILTEIGLNGEQATNDFKKWRP